MPKWRITPRLKLRPLLLEEIIYIYKRPRVGICRNLMPKRLQSKKTKTGEPVFGAPSEADAPNARLKSVNEGALTVSYSTREAPGQKKVIPSIETSSCRVFANNLQKLFGTAEVIEGVAQRPADRMTARLRRRTQAQLGMLPPHLSMKLLSVLQSIHPSKLTHAFLSEYFLNGTAIRFTAQMAGVNRFTLANVEKKAANDLTDLELSGLDWIEDEHFAHLIKHCKNLSSLNLKCDISP